MRQTGKRQVTPLDKIGQRILRLERRKRFLVSGNRTRDVRDKFALGGLVVKAGLRNTDRAFLLGVLAEAATIAAGSDEYRRFVEIGDSMFCQTQKPEQDVEIGDSMFCQTQKPEQDVEMRSADG